MERDSLNQLAQFSPLVYMRVSIDSCGYVSSLDMLSFVLKKQDNQVINISGSELKNIETCMIKNTQLTFTPADILIELSCPADSIGDLITSRLNTVIPKYFDGNIVTYHTFRLKDSDIASDYEIDCFADEILNQATLDRGVTKVADCPETYNIQITPDELNDAIILLSMIYAFGDFNINRWLDKYNFDLILSLDENGVVSDVSCEAIDRLPSNLDLLQLSNFFKNNNVRLNSNNSQGLVTFKFPGPLYDKNTRSKGFLDRMNNLETKIWHTLLLGGTSHYILSD